MQVSKFQHYDERVEELVTEHLRKHGGCSREQSLMFIAQVASTVVLDRIRQLVRRSIIKTVAQIMGIAIMWGVVAVTAELYISAGAFDRNPLPVFLVIVAGFALIWYFKPIMEGIAHRNRKEASDDAAALGREFIDSYGLKDYESDMVSLEVAKLLTKTLTEKDEDYVRQAVD